MFKLIYMTMLTMSTMLVLSSSSWLMVWAMLEMNLMAMTPILALYASKASSDSSMKYFITQSFASVFLILSIIMMLIHPSFNYMLLVLTMSLLLKLGSAPFHSWFPSVMVKTSWFNCMLLATWQKIAPLIIITNMYQSMIMYLFILSSALVGPLGGFNQISLKKIMSYSSIGHLAWMITASILSAKILVIYFIIYSMLSIVLMMFFNSQNMNKISDFSSLNSSLMLLMFFINLMSLGGIPPLIGFIPKWMMLEYLVQSMPMLAVILIFSSLVTLFFYLRLSHFQFLMTYSLLSKNMLMVPNIVMSMMTILSLLSIPLMIILM